MGTGRPTPAYPRVAALPPGGPPRSPTSPPPLQPPRPIDPPRARPAAGGADSARQLALAARDGERSAFEALVARFGGELLAAIEKQVRDHHSALDVAQDVWVKVYRGLASYNAARPFRPWLFAIAFNAVRDDHRRRERRPDGQATLDEALGAGHAAPDRYDPSGRVEETVAIDAALSAVPEPFRAAVHLVDVLGMTYEEAAESLGCALGTAKSRVYRGRLVFRDHYERDDLDAGAPAPHPKANCS